MLFSNKKSRLIPLIILLIGMSGSLLFFPLKLDGNHTCFCQWLFFSKTVWQEKYSNSPVGDMTSFTKHQELIQSYVVPFGILWWFSIGLAFGGVYYLRKKLPED